MFHSYRKDRTWCSDIVTLTRLVVRLGQHVSLCTCVITLPYSKARPVESGGVSRTQSSSRHGECTLNSPFSIMSRGTVPEVRQQTVLTSVQTKLTVGVFFCLHPQVSAPPEKHVRGVTKRWFRDFRTAEFCDFQKPKSCRRVLSRVGLLFPSAKHSR